MTPHRHHHPHPRHPNALTQFYARPLQPGDAPTLLGFLARHYQIGGLEQHSYDILCVLVFHMNRISQILLPTSADVGKYDAWTQDNTARIVALTCSIEDICAVFGVNVVKRCNRATDAMRDLPDLADVDDAEFRERMHEWADVMHFLHEPNNNDTTMYRNFLIYFDQFVHAPYLQLRRGRPFENEELGEAFRIVRNNFEDLIYVCELANETVEELNREYAVALHLLVQERPMDLVRGSVSPMPVLSEAEEHATITHLGQMTTTLDSLDSFFEDNDSATSQHTKGKDLEEKAYNTVPTTARTPADAHAAQANPSPSALTPRVFTSTFEDLEKSVKDIGLHRTTSTDSVDIKIRDFAPPTPSLRPSPASLLMRSESITSKQVDWSECILAGQAVQRRRPSRAMTIHDQSGDLGAWLNVMLPHKSLSVSDMARQRQRTL